MSDDSQHIENVMNQFANEVAIYIICRPQVDSRKIINDIFTLVGQRIQTKLSNHYRNNNRNNPEQGD